LGISLETNSAEVIIAAAVGETCTIAAFVAATSLGSVCCLAGSTVPLPLFVRTSLGLPKSGCIISTCLC